jgi:hypothetical protein
MRANIFEVIRLTAEGNRFAGLQRIQRNSKLAYPFIVSLSPKINNNCFMGTQKTLSKSML